MSPYEARLKRICANRKNPISFDSLSLIDTLNKEFKPERIYFELMGQEGRDLIQGSRDRKTLKIYIEVGILRLANDPTDKLINRFIECIQHEMIHREQMVRSGGKLKFFIPPEDVEHIDADTLSKYYNDKSELMAYSIETVTILRHEGYTDNQILAMVKYPKKFDVKIEKSEAHLAEYIRAFGVNSPQYKKFVTTVYQYITGEQK